MDRRQFLHGAVLGASALAFSRPFSAFAKEVRLLKAVTRTIEINGKSAKVYGLLNAAGKHGLVFEEGEAFNVLLDNQLSEPTIIHWHGLTPPWESDGVGDAPMPLLMAGEKRAYNFPLTNTGTHWMHAHTLQEQNLLAAPLIIRSKEEMKRDEQEVVVLLHDFSFTPAEELLARLQGSSGHGDHGGHAMPMQGHGDKMSNGKDHEMMGHQMPSKPAPSSHDAHGAASGAGAMPMQGMAMDVNDIEYDAYLANDRTLDDPEVVAVEMGGRVRLRIINGATGTGFTIDLGGLDGELIAVDGENLAVGVKGKQFPVAMGQRVDIVLQLPKETKAFPILALREGARERTGLILQPKGASIEKLSSLSDHAAPILDMTLEQTLQMDPPGFLRKARKVNQRFDVALNGTMAGYTWSMDMAQPVMVKKGDYVEITMRNQSMMAHPMHLHGHHFQVVAIDGKRINGARRDTVNIAPGRSVTIAVEANNPGKWAFHCHHLYHMAAGMMATFSYDM